MLLGYIVDVVSDKQLAEQYLADTFSAVPLHYDTFLKPGENDYCKLQNLARKQLSPYFETLKNCDASNRAPLRTHKYTGDMTVEQQLVFCGLHYHGKTTAMLAAELNITETGIKKLLKEAFYIIRNHSRDEGIY